MASKTIIKCPKCNTVFKLEEGRTLGDKCPVCGAKFLSDDAPKGFKYELKKIIELYGKYLLLSPKKLHGYILDTVKDYEREKRMFKRLVDTSIFKVVHDNSKDHKAILLEIDKIYEDFFIDKVILVEFANMLLFAIDEKEIVVEQKKTVSPKVDNVEPTPVNISEQKTAKTSVNKASSKIKASPDFEINGTELVNYTGTDQDVVIPEGVTKINFHAFDNAPFITSIHIPNSILPDSLDRTIYNTLNKCVNLKEIRVYSNHPTHFVHNGVLYRKSGENAILVFCPRNLGGSFSLFPNTIRIHEKAFYECSKITSIVIPDKVTAIGNNAFEQCSQLKSIILPESLKMIGDSAFTKCSALESLVIPGNVKIIPNYLCMSCYSLNKVALKNGVERINKNAFSFCDSLSIIDLGDTLLHIEQSAFQYDKKIEKIYMPKSLIQVDDNAFYGYSYNAPTIKIKYSGTKAEFNNINFGVKVFSQKLVVNCKDGIINI